MPTNDEIIQLPTNLPCNLSKAVQAKRNEKRNKCVNIVRDMNPIDATLTLSKNSFKYGT